MKSKLVKIACSNQMHLTQAKEGHQRPAIYVQLSILRFQCSFDAYRILLISSAQKRKICFCAHKRVHVVNILHVEKESHSMAVHFALLLLYSLSSIWNQFVAKRFINKQPSDIVLHILLLLWLQPPPGAVAFFFFNSLTRINKFFSVWPCVPIFYIFI